MPFDDVFYLIGKEQLPTITELTVIDAEQGVVEVK